MECTGRDGKGKERREAPSPARFPFFSIIAIFIGIHSGSLYGGEMNRIIIGIDKVGRLIE